MGKIGIGLAIYLARMAKRKEGKESALEGVPISLDMGCRSVVNCVQFIRGGGSVIPVSVIERTFEALVAGLTNAFEGNSMVLYQREY